MEFSFEFEKSITKDFLLSKHSQEKYMEHYTGVQVKKGYFGVRSEMILILLAVILKINLEN